jgi:lactate dehydrogenase-like 2-hydroxyacid dehydrogenase
MTVIATARTRPPGTVEVTFVDTPTLLADSDVITIHTPLPPQLTSNSATFTRTGQQHCRERSEPR